MDVVIREIPIRTDISARNSLILSAHNALTTLYKAVYPGDTSLVLDTNCGRWVTRTIFERCSNVAELDSTIADPVFIKHVNPDKNDMLLTQDMLLAIRELFCQCENVLALTSSVISYAGVCLTKAVKASPSIRLASAYQVKSLSEKRLEVENIISLHSLLRDTAIALLGAEDVGMELANDDVYANLTKYRLLSEMDSFSLSEFDGLEIIDVDYITI